VASGGSGPKKEATTVTNPAAAGEFNEPMIVAGGGWAGVSLNAATNLRVPIAFALAVALFILVQALIDRRDPKLSRAPERGDDDSAQFE
jgi:hypothetical protein